ncbi:UAP56-interacting factor isoform X1 [Xenopus laevis]|uniref:UAP56-interacting factor n=1 Tax=Xenopus laevis TaxID=8355 RepID=A0A8J0VJA8_XENLA|nr:UAP56-interacting factor isoform X1 [Xenopus laevis]
MAPLKTSVSDTIDKIDMSLDDIIKLNKQEQNRKQLKGRYNGSFRQFRNSWGRWGAQHTSGAGNNLRSQGLRKRPYGVKTGLAMRKMASWKGISPLNHQPLVRNSPGQLVSFRKRLNPQRSPDSGVKTSSSLQRYYLRSSYAPTNTFRSGFRMDQQRETRQATFLSRRGLKVQTLMDMDQHLDLPELSKTPPWRTSVSSGGSLTVSIDNPSAVTLPSSLGSRLPRPPFPFLTKKEGSETKVPKGVPLEFDINSVAKQSGITLNERFKILKEQRLAQAFTKGSRFVTVG